MKFSMGMLSLTAAAAVVSLSAAAVRPAKAAVPAPQIVGVSTAVSSPFITVTWRRASGASTYKVCRRTENGTTDTVLASVTDTSFIDFSLEAGTLYRYRVMAKSPAGDSAYSGFDSTITDPYMLVSPKAGDVYHVGDTLSVKFSASEGKNGGIRMSIDGGLDYFTIQRGIGYEGTFIPMSTPVVRVVIPPYFVRTIWDDSLGATRPDTVRTVSDQVKVHLFDYGRPSTIMAVSYGVFKILPSLAVIPRQPARAPGSATAAPWVLVPVDADGERVTGAIAGCAALTPAGRLLTTGRNATAIAPRTVIVVRPAERPQR